MSVIVALRDGDSVWLACDSQVSYGARKKTTGRKIKLCKQQNGTVILGSVYVS